VVPVITNTRVEIQHSMVPRVLLTSLIAMAMLTYYFESTAADRESFYSNVIGVSAIVGFGSSSSSGGRFLDVGIDQSQQEEFDGNVYETRSEENRIPIKPGEFWVTDEDEAIPPFPVNFTPPNDSWGSFETLPHCSIDYADSRDGFPTKVVFVNVVRTEANWVQDFLTSYASTCHAGYASVGMSNVCLMQDCLKKSIEDCLLVFKYFFTLLTTRFYFSLFHSKQPYVRVFLGNQW